MKCQAGFSMIETVTTVMIVSILLFLSYPSIADWKRTAELRSESSSMVGRLRMMKMKAIQQNCYVVMKMRENGYSIFIDDGSEGGKAGDWVRQENEAELIDYHFPQGTTMTNNFNNRTRFKGRVGNRAGTIKIMNQESDTLKVIINPSGRIRVEKG